MPSKVVKSKAVKSNSDTFEVYLGTFIDNAFTWYSVAKYKDLKSAYKGFKNYVNTQLKYTDEELQRVWDTGRLDIELRQGNKLLNWVGIYSRKVASLDKKEEKEVEKGKVKKESDKDEKKDSTKKKKKDSAIEKRYPDSMPSLDKIKSAKVVMDEDSELSDTDIFSNKELFNLFKKLNDKMYRGDFEYNEFTGDAFVYGETEDHMLYMTLSYNEEDDPDKIFLSVNCRVNQGDDSDDYIELPEEEDPYEEF